MFSVQFVGHQSCHHTLHMKYFDVVRACLHSSSNISGCTEKLRRLQYRLFLQAKLFDKTFCNILNLCKKKNVSCNRFICQLKSPLIAAAEFLTLIYGKLLSENIFLRRQISPAITTAIEPIVRHSNTTMVYLSIPLKRQRSYCHLNLLRAMSKIWTFSNTSLTKMKPQSCKLKPHFYIYLFTFFFQFLITSLT